MYFQVARFKIEIGALVENHRKNCNPSLAGSFAWLAVVFLLSGSSDLRSWSRVSLCVPGRGGPFFFVPPRCVEV